MSKMVVGEIRYYGEEDKKENSKNLLYAVDKLFQSKKGLKTNLNPDEKSPVGTYSYRNCDITLQLTPSEDEHETDDLLVNVVLNDTRGLYPKKLLFSKKSYESERVELVTVELKVNYLMRALDEMGINDWYMPYSIN